MEQMDQGGISICINLDNLSGVVDVISVSESFFDWATLLEPDEENFYLFEAFEFGMMHCFVKLNRVIKLKQQSWIQSFNSMNDAGSNFKWCSPKINSIISTIKSMNKLEVESHVCTVHFWLCHKRIKITFWILL